MIKDTIEKVKDLITKDPNMTFDNKLAIQSLLSDIRGELLGLDYHNGQVLARLDVYADIANKILDRLADRNC